MMNLVERYAYKENKLFYHNLFRLAIPMGFTALLGALLNMTDTLMISQLNEEAIAAVGSGNKLFFVLMVTLYGVYSGFGVFISQYWGKKDIKRLQTVYMLGIVTGVILSGIVSIITLVMPKTIMQLFSDDPLVWQYGVDYLRIVAFSYVISALIFSFEMVSRSTEKVNLPLIVSFFGILFNIILNYILIFGKFGFEPMGIEGAALGTLIARGIQLLIYFGYIIITRNQVLFIKITQFQFEPELFKKIFFKTIPVVGNEFFWSTGMMAVFIAYGRLGTDALASMQLFDSVFSLLTVFMWGVANASAIMIGKKIGENDLVLAKWYSSLFIVNSLIIGAITGLVIAASIPFMDVIFSNLSDTVISNLKQLLLIVSIYMPFKLLSATFIIGILRSGGDTLFAFIVETLCLWGWAVPIAFLLVYFTPLTLPLIFMVVSFEEVIKDVVCYKRYKSGRYLHNLVH